MFPAFHKTDVRHRAAAARCCAFALLFSLAAAATAQVPAFQSGFPITVSGDQLRRASVNLVDVDGDQVVDIVVGGLDGRVYAYKGNGTLLWDFASGTAPIENKVAVGDVDGDGFVEVIVAAGHASAPTAPGALYVLNHLGGLQCQFTPGDFDGNSVDDGIFSTPAIGDVDGNDGGRLEIAFGGYDAFVRLINHDCSLVWERDNRDTIWSSPALGDLDRDGFLDVVIGGSIHQEGPPYNTINGGILYAIDRLGNDLPGFPIQIDETIQSSPSLADLDGDGFLDVVVGTGRCWSDPACAPPQWGYQGEVGKYLNAWDHLGNYLPGWPVSTPGQYAFGSPALADVDDDGLPEVIVNTIDHSVNPFEGRLWALNANGTSVPGWPRQPTTPADGAGNVRMPNTEASPIVADVNGDGVLEILIAGSFEVVVFAEDGTQISRNVCCPPPPGSLQLVTSHQVASTPAVGDVDGDGDLEVVVGGATTGGGSGAIYAWDFSTSITAEMPWPAFRRTPDNRALLRDSIFADSFESGNTSAWSSAVP